MKKIKFFAAIILALVTIIVSVLYFFYSSHYVGKALQLLGDIKFHEKIQQKDSEEIHQKKLVEKFYEKHQMAVIAEAKSKALQKRNLLLEMINYADSLGLDPKDYHKKIIDDFDRQLHNSEYTSEENLLRCEILFTDAAISFLHDVAYGKEISELSYNGIKLHVDTNKVTEALKKVLTTNAWKEVIDSLEPAISEYQILKKIYQKLIKTIYVNRDIDTLLCRANDTVLILNKLQALSFISEDESTQLNKDSLYKISIGKFQQSIGLPVTNNLDNKTIEALNVPLSYRLAQIRQSLNCWRWTNRVAERKLILVNIPAANLRIIDRNAGNVSFMKVIVGKEQTRTPVFTAYLTKVITYPYWIPPYSIASKEILPKVQKDISYLERNGFVVLDKKGNQVDPRQINWKNITAKNLTYTFRQGTGCDNSLGVMKFDLSSPYSIYLHDTNRRDLFFQNNRHLSHGCIRVEKPFELAEFLLNKSVDTLYLSQCLKNEKPTHIKVNEKIPVLIFYMTADINHEGKVEFYKDVYKKIPLEGKDLVI
ncbi:MAG: L,D-transpeptidase family protein [Chitinophagales bacterium]|nr:L,D-transpeptidase family protein [Chitinophagales bacterium]MDW8273475.1 L,D-transpeptidase family protein [Chitinophagales bacterium]